MNCIQKIKVGVFNETQSTCVCINLVNCLFTSTAAGGSATEAR